MIPAALDSLDHIRRAVHVPSTPETPGVEEADHAPHRHNDSGDQQIRSVAIGLDTAIASEWRRVT
jgi:hypothetical protein